MFVALYTKFHTSTGKYAYINYTPTLINDLIIYNINQSIDLFLIILRVSKLDVNKQRKEKSTYVDNRIR